MAELDSVLNYIPNQIRKIILDISEKEENREQNPNRRNKIKE